MQIELVFGNRQDQHLIRCDVPQACTVEQAIKLSGIEQRFPDTEFLEKPLGIFSKPASLTTQLQPNDRIEFYEPLTIDPKEARRLRAQPK